MNRTHPIIWSVIRQTWVVAGEQAKSKTKTGGIQLTALLLSLLTPLGASNALAELDPNALPNGGEITSGSGQISQQSNILTVHQQSDKLITQWQQFNIGQDAEVNFQQPSVDSLALNRVTSDNPSSIQGQLNANGQVMLVNPAGIVIGKTGQVKAGGFIASTLDIEDRDFENGEFTFSNNGQAGTVDNQGVIRTKTGGTVAFIAPQISNSGEITTPQGSTLLTSADRVNLDFSGDGLISYSLDRDTAQGLIENSGQITAQGGQIILHNKALEAAQQAVVNNTGTLQAQTLNEQEGRILLLADMEQGSVNAAGQLDASAPETGNGGFIETSAASVNIDPELKVTTQAEAGETGEWLIDPTDYTIAESGGNITGDALSTSLASTDVTINTAGAGGNGDIFVQDEISWSSNRLTLSADNDIHFTSDLHGSGTAKLALEYGQANAASGNTSNYYLHGSQINLPAGSGFDSTFSTKQGSDGVTINYNVITSLGDEGSTTAADLQGMQGNLSADYALGAEIDASATKLWTGWGFLPIGYSYGGFTGSFHGLGHTINELTGNRSFFHLVNGSEIRDVGLVNVDVGSNDFNIGGLATLAGLSSPVLISNVYITGSIIGDEYAGGLIGRLFDGEINNSFSTARVQGFSRVGGLVGWNEGVISNSYTTGEILSDDSGGGLVGYNAGDISDSYATGTVTGDHDIGGLVGANSNSGVITDSYASGTVTGASNVGGLIGDNSGTVTTSYWDTETTTQASSDGGVGFTTANALKQANYTGFDFTNTWYMTEDMTRPMLRAFFAPELNGTYTINNVYQLQGMAADRDGDYLLGQNIDASLTQSIDAADIWVGKGFAPVGDAGSLFFGSLNGNSHTIDDLTIDRTATLAVGLFGFSQGNIQALGLSGGSISGGTAVGGIIGFSAAATISNVFNTGTVQGTSVVGGIVGESFASVSNSFATGQVVSGDIAGGLVGISHSDISNSYATGRVIGNTAGGLVGQNDAPGSITNSYAQNELFAGTSGGLVATNTGSVVNSYWDTSSGLLSGGGTGLTTSELKQIASFSGWGISANGGDATVWRIYEGETSPLLRSFMTPLTLTASDVNRTYDTTAYSGGAYTATESYDMDLVDGTASYGGAAQGAINAGTYAITLDGLHSTQFGYDLILSDGTLTIDKADATVTANSSTVTYNGNSQSVTGFTVDGLVGGETVAVLDGLSTSGGVGTDSGTYAHTVSGSDENYNLTFVDGVLTIGKAGVTIKADNATVTYNGQEQSVSGFTITGLSESQAEELAAKLSESGGVGTDAGTYTYSLSGSYKSNYSLNFIDGTLTIEKADAQVTANSAELVYNGIEQQVSGYNITGLVNGETVAVLDNITTSGGQGSLADEYIHSISGSDNNYNLSFNDGMLTIIPAPLTISANDHFTTFNGQPYSDGNGASYNGFVNGETESVLVGQLSYTGNSQGAVDAGSYTITPMGLNADNYEISFEDGRLLIADISDASPRVQIASELEQKGAGSGLLLSVNQIQPPELLITEMDSTRELIPLD